MENGAVIAFERLEIVHLDLRYTHTRVRAPRSVLRMADSMERFGQISPVLVVKGTDDRPILIDGYLRIQALHRLGRDMVGAQVWDGEESDALLYILARSQERHWEAYEQASLIKELHIHHKRSQSDIARLLGKTQSWVSRRLSLLDNLPETINEAVRSGRISTWGATRILVPMARANSEHAHKMSEHLKKAKMSTRDLCRFFEHYKRANKKVRENMVDRPHLFIKTTTANKTDRESDLLDRGVEGRFVKDMNVVCHILRRLVNQASEVLYPGQNILDRRSILTAFNETHGVMVQLKKTIRRLSDGSERETRGDSDLACGGVRDPKNQGAVETVA